VLICSLPFVLGIKLACLACFSVLPQIWRYVSFLEIRRILLALLAASALLAGLQLVGSAAGDDPLLTTFSRVPRGVLMIDFVVGLFGIVVLRGVARHWDERGNGASAAAASTGDVRTLLIGAGRAGAGVARTIRLHPELGIDPVGFLDDNPAKR